MTFGPHHYVPVLKIKRGEKRALRTISSTFHHRITPLLEIVERRSERVSTVDKHLNTAFKDLADSVLPYPRCFLDTREVEADGPAAADEVFRRATAEGLVFTPVTGISRSADVVAALKNRTHGVALRLVRAELEGGNLAANLRVFISRHKLEPEETDLIVDLGAVDDLVVAGIIALMDAFLAEVPDHQRWRTFTVSACAFPSSMGGVERNSYEFVERAEWRAWKDRLHTRRQSLPRHPSFSDCVIQHPVGVEGFDPRIMQVSASVRYALSETWLLIKGESTRITPPSVQFPALATRLVYGHLRSNFAGASHCGGCESMKAAADGVGGFGSAEAWRRLGTIHHITMVMQELASLAWP